MALLLGPALAAAWLGCSVEENYELLSFFFDGVPDPHAPIGAGFGVGGGRIPGAKYYTHEPFKEGACTQCHRSPVDFGMSWQDSSMCLDCHADAKQGYAYLHGPVAGDACLWCHAPHESTIRPLLRVGAPELCMQCHGLEMQATPRTWPHDDLTRDCLDCHFAHGDDDRFFVKEAAEETAAPEEPAPGQETDEPSDG